MRTNSKIAFIEYSGHVFVCVETAQLINFILLYYLCFN